MSDDETAAMSPVGELRRKRDLFAAHAMTGLLMAKAGSTSIEGLARQARLYADALIAELDKAPDVPTDPKTRPAVVSLREMQLKQRAPKGE